MLRSKWLLVAASILVVGSSVAAVTASIFLAAGPGIQVPFTPVPLPPLKAGAILPTLPNAFAPTQQQLLSGNTIITTAAQMKAIWGRLFKGPYDPSLFDFSTDFVVLMGAGPMSLGSFDISAVESVDASYNGSFGFGGTDSDRFLTVIGTTFTPGIEPQDPPPPTYRVSAVRIPKTEFDDIVFHRNFVMGV